ncbi:hypothetical protein EJ08DRAFT_668176 [Tothia fuscella]|uniref:Malic enzyme n=1 Tax=Tothia fuscella TaxID=1048955 RepID=A0A9P4U358_9PEZI|nr:hypothetical protein EJ08DRAFT_668176 [Tothia fuscella]
MTSHNKAVSHSQYGHLPLSTSGPMPCAISGSALLRTPYLNKGTAFTSAEREQFKLHGLLPPNVQTLEGQVSRAYKQFKARNNDIGKNTFMTSLKEQNEVLYYKLILDNLKEMFSIIYTPTEGEAIAQYSELFRRPEGCFLNVEDLDRIEADLDPWGAPEDIDLIVVSDGEQILGIGDQGVGAILISIAKLAIYTLCAGINPTRTLPVVLDVGTNVPQLFRTNYPLYLGLKRNRVRGEEYDAFVERFVRAAHKRYPKAYIHFEDFGLQNARRILDKYTPELACFNDDVQGTGCVTLAGVMAALHVSKVKMQDMRVVIFGSGTAGTGIADQLRDAIAVETENSKEDANRQIWCFDKPGLLLKSQKNELTTAQAQYAREDDEWSGKGHQNLLDVIKEVKPHVLIGTSTKPGAFTEEVVREMARHVERPTIFPLSNPTKLHEAVPEDLFKWTDGKVLCATGSPFDAVEYNGTKYEIAECNNSTIFPGIGLGCILSRARLLPTSLLVAATKALAAQSPALKDPKASLLPDVTEVREISVQIAKGVIRAAEKEGLNRETDIPQDDKEIEEWIREQMWDARYRELQKVDADSADAHAKGEAGTGSFLRVG